MIFTYCRALDPEGQPTCWTRIRRRQPGQICNRCWQTLATDGTVSQRCDLAREPDLPDNIAGLLTGDRSNLVRTELARRATLPTSVLERLCADTDEQVGLAVAARTDRTTTQDATLLHSPHQTVLTRLASTASPEVAAVLARHPDPNVAHAAARPAAA